MLALPGGAYVYQGEELGLPEVEDLPVEVLQDPRSWQTGPEHTRDGCRVPIPWSGAASPYGFSPAGLGRSPGCRCPPTGPRSRSRPRTATRRRC